MGKISSSEELMLLVLMREHGEEEEEEGGKLIFKGKCTFVKIQGDILWAERLKFLAGFFGGFNLADSRGGIWGCSAP